jgi:hypothetical protein
MPSNSRKKRLILCLLNTLPNALPKLGKRSMMTTTGRARLDVCLSSSAAALPSGLRFRRGVIGVCVDASAPLTGGSSASFGTRVRFAGSLVPRLLFSLGIEFRLLCAHGGGFGI